MEIRDMATAYVEVFKERLEQAKEQLAAQQKYVNQLMQHLEECEKALNTENQPNNNVTSEVVPVPNPFQS